MDNRFRFSSFYFSDGLNYEMAGMVRSDTNVGKLVRYHSYNKHILGAGSYMRNWPLATMWSMTGNIREIMLFYGKIMYSNDNSHHSIILHLLRIWTCQVRWWSLLGPKIKLPFAHSWFKYWIYFNLHSIDTNQFCQSWTPSQIWYGPRAMHMFSYVTNWMYWNKKLEHFSISSIRWLSFLNIFSRLNQVTHTHTHHPIYRNWNKKEIQRKLNLKWMQSIFHKLTKRSLEINTYIFGGIIHDTNNNRLESKSKWIQARTKKRRECKHKNHGECLIDVKVICRTNLTFPRGYTYRHIGILVCIRYVCF